MIKMTLFLITLHLLFGSCNQADKKQISDDSNPKNTITQGDTVNQLSNNVMVIYQDKKNNYWFGSWEDGLYKYDGKIIIHFSTKHGLPSNRVEEIKEDHLGNLYFNTANGIIAYNGFQFERLKENNGGPENWTLAPNDLWFKNFTNNQSVYRYDGNILYKLSLPKNELGEEWIQKNPSYLNPYAIYCTYKDTKGNIWFGTAASGTFRFNGSKFDWITENDVNEFHNGPSNGVRSIIEDKDGYFWFNSEFRYMIFENSTSNEKPFYDRKKSIGKLDGKKDSQLNEYLSIAKDNDNNLWIATYLDGVWKYDGKKTTQFTIQENGTNIHLFYIYKDNRGTIWLGTHEHGAWKLDGEKFSRFVS